MSSVVFSWLFSVGGKKQINKLNVLIFTVSDQVSHNRFWAMLIRFVTCQWILATLELIVKKNLENF